MAQDDPGQTPRYPIRYRGALLIGVGLLVLSLGGSCLAAPFLFPLFQAVLLIPMMPAGLFGVIGGWRRNWWVTLGLTCAGLSAYVVYDVQTNPLGYRVILDTLLLGRPPAGLRYYDSWSLLLQATILLLCPAVAIISHALIDHWRFRKWESLARAARCEGCGYLLRGLIECRCPECGRPFDADQVKEAIRCLDEAPPGLGQLYGVAREGINPNSGRPGKAESATNNTTP